MDKREKRDKDRMVLIFDTTIRELIESDEDTVWMIMKRP